MKHEGLNVAADPFMTLSYLGVVGGFVACVADVSGDAFFPEQAGYPALCPLCQGTHLRALRQPGEGSHSPHLKAQAQGNEHILEIG